MPKIKELTTEQRVLNLIYTIRNSFEGANIVYTKGSCYQLYLILKQVFPEAEAWATDNHVITEIDGKFYDISGLADNSKYIRIKDESSYLVYTTLKFDMFEWREETKGVKSVID